MWKRHPLIQAAIAVTLTIVVMVGTLFSGLLDSKFWLDAKAEPLTVEGTIRNFRPATYANPGRFDLVSSTQTAVFEINAYISAGISEGQKARVRFSPNLKHVYTLEVLASPSILSVQDKYQPDALFQPFQTIAVLTLLLLGLLIVGSSLYAALALLDWLRKPGLILGTVISRLEQADFNAGYGLIVRAVAPSRKTYRFYLHQSDFIRTDGADFVQIAHTPILSYVKRIEIVASTELASTLSTTAAIRWREQSIPLHYLSKWQFLFFLYADLVGALILFSVPIIVTVTTLPLWLEPVTVHYQLYERILLPSVALLALMMSIFLTLNFLRKWRDVRRPKRLTEGPVLSKWRVNGVSNENRRQIVVADGGLAGGSEAVHKFDISAQIFDELKVGDVVKIEHTPRLRFILRLEVTGHQELAQKV